MIVSVRKSHLSGNIKIPASKSISQRVAVCALLNNGQTAILNYGNSEDEKNTLAAVKTLGANVFFENESLIINSTGGINFQGILNAGESGLGLRLLVPVSALSNNEITVNTERSLNKRDVSGFNYLKDLGVELNYNNCLPPVTVKGPLNTNNIFLELNNSSQYLTGLITVFAFVAEKETEIIIDRIVSKPYIDISLEVLRNFGCIIKNESYKKFVVIPRSGDKRDFTYNIEGDWSSAAFIFIAGILCGNIEIGNLKLSSFQGDKIMLDLLLQLGAGIKTEGELILIPRKKLDAFYFDATDYPDLFPPLAALAVFCNGTSRIKGLHRLTNKESNREKSIINVLTQLGVSVYTKDNELCITGNCSLNGAVIDSYGDHRIVMMASLIGLAAEIDLEITNAEAVSKSYPSFFEQIISLGGNINFKL